MDGAHGIMRRSMLKKLGYVGGAPPESLILMGIPYGYGNTLYGPEVCKVLYTVWNTVEGRNFSVRNIPY